MELENQYWCTIEYVTLAGRAGIVLYPYKFQFADRIVDFAKFRLSESTAEPLPKYINAIKNFSKPQSITDIRSWFGLVNQVANYAQLRNLLEPFKPFLSFKRKFEWLDGLYETFISSKEKNHQGHKTWRRNI